MKNSNIATIVYKEYTENVDMNNELYNHDELINLWENDKDIIRVEFYENGLIVMSWTRKFIKTQNIIKKLDKLVKATEDYRDMIENYGADDEVVENYGYRQLQQLFDKAHTEEQKTWKTLLERMKENKEVNVDAYFDKEYDMLCRELFQYTEDQALEYLQSNGGY